MANFNKIVLAGHLTRDWETRTTKAGTAISKTGIAVNRRTRDNEETMFVDIIAFGQIAENVSKHTGKGRPLLVEGRLSLSQWEGKDGTKRSKHEVIVETFQFMRDDLRSALSMPNSVESAQVEHQQELTPTVDDDLPF